MIKKMMKMKIQKRLLHSSIVTSTIMMVATVVALAVILYATSRYSYVLNYYAFPQEEVGHAMTTLADMQSCTRGAIGYEMQALIDKLVEEHDAKKAELEGYLGAIKKTITTEEEQKIMERAENYIAAYYEFDEQVISLGATTDKELQKQAQAMAVAEMEREYERAFKELENLMETKVNLGAQAKQQIYVTTSILILVVVVLIIASGVVALQLSRKITKTITKPMDLLVERMTTFAEGDLSSPFPEHDVEDEIADVLKAVSSTTAKLQVIFADMEHLLAQMADGNFAIATSCEEEYVGEYQGLLLAMRQMNRQMDSTLKNVREVAEAVASGAGNLADASQSLAEGATDQAASVEEMQATIDEITTALERTATEVNSSVEKAESCANEAEKSRLEMDTLMAAMDRISETSLKIGNIIAEMEDIASQTNLLSLNASIEAARAGEAGMGFAVVADEIRKLAEQSANSATNTRKLIEASVAEVNNGNEAAKRTSEVLLGVVSSIHEIAENSREISISAAQQAQAMEQANAGIERISEVVQANSATAEEASATSEELSAEAVGMEEMVNRFSFRA